MWGRCATRRSRAPPSGREKVREGASEGPRGPFWEKVREGAREGAREGKRREGEEERRRERGRV